ncbi:MAG: leucine rich repeat containing protein [Herminiimonas sp.]|nr:leucine rich repeat containing protein [Herminiimonas sp.]
MDKLTADRAANIPAPAAETPAQGPVSVADTGPPTLRSDRSAQSPRIGSPGTATVFNPSKSSEPRLVSTGPGHQVAPSRRWLPGLPVEDVQNIIASTVADTGGAKALMRLGQVSRKAHDATRAFVNQPGQEKLKSETDQLARAYTHKVTREMGISVRLVGSFARPDRDLREGDIASALRDYSHVRVDIDPVPPARWPMVIDEASRGKSTFEVQASRLQHSFSELVPLLERIKVAEGSKPAIFLEASSNNIGASDLNLLAALLNGNPAVRGLTLDDNGINDEGTQILANILPDARLANLSLCKNNITRQGAESLAAALDRSGIKVLNLDRNQLGDDGAAALAGSLRTSSTLKELHLPENGISDRGLIALAEAVAVNQSLTVLDLSGNRLGAAGIAALASALEVNRTLTHLHLRGLVFDQAGATALVSALTRNSSVQLDLGECLYTGDLEVVAPLYLEPRVTLR